VNERDPLDEQQQFQEQLDQEDLDQPVDYSQPPKRKRGAQPGNSNGFLTGVTVAAKNIKRAASRAKLGTVRRRRIASEVTARITDDLGGPEHISEAARVIIAIVSKQCARLDAVHRLYARYANEPKLKNNFRALLKLDAMVRPLETAVVANLRELGLKKTPKVKDVYDWQPAGEENGNGNHE
jgi:hypothetical protein